MRTRPSVAAGVATAALTTALTVALPGAAHAEMYGVDDGRDTSHGSDILAISVRNGERNLDVTTTHADLRPDPATGSGGALFIDTDRHDPGPEYVLVAGYYRGTDYQLLHTDGFRHATWGRPVQDGDYLMRVSYRRDTVHVRISQGALGEPDRVRVSARASGTRRDGTSDGLVDWVGKRRWFTPWLDRG
jgi:hypothetical protein